MSQTDTALRCFQSIKVKKFESNSQLAMELYLHGYCCFQSIKVKKFESNSQLAMELYLHGYAVFRVSKLKSLKAIHNRL